VKADSKYKTLKARKTRNYTTGNGHCIVANGILRDTVQNETGTVVRYLGVEHRTVSGVPSEAVSDTAYRCRRRQNAYSNTVDDSSQTEPSWSKEDPGDEQRASLCEIYVSFWHPGPPSPG